MSPLLLQAGPCRALPEQTRTCLVCSVRYSPARSLVVVAHSCCTLRTYSVRTPAVHCPYVLRPYTCCTSIRVLPPCVHLLYVNPCTSVYDLGTLQSVYLSLRPRYTAVLRRTLATGAGTDRPYTVRAPTRTDRLYTCRTPLVSGQ